MRVKSLLVAAGMLSFSGIVAAHAETLTIATVNNGDMIRMQKLSGDFEAKNPGITLEWVILEENTLRQKVTQDIAVKGGQYDIMTIGTYEVPIWAKQNWLLPLEFNAAYDVDDLLPALRKGLSYEDKLYAAPFYGESSMVMYRTDLFEQAGLTMPEKPTWEFIADAARKITDKEKETYGICLRGKAGWGENVCLVSALSNSFGARWFDESWEPQFDTAEWKEALNFYVDLMQDAGPPGASSNGFNENLALFQSGKCAMWIDATVAASFVTNPEESQVADQVAFAMAPNKEGVAKHSNWLWAWNLAVPAGTKKADAALKFISWATSKEYTQMVAAKEGWANVPPGTRTSLYSVPQYAELPFARLTLESMLAADPTKPTVDPVPYVGIQFVAIPEFQGIGTAVGQQFSAAVAGQITADQALQMAQRLTEREMKKAGYIK